MCGRTKTALEVLSEQPKKGGLNKGVIMVVQKICEDLSAMSEKQAKQDEKIENIEKSISALEINFNNQQEKIDRILSLCEQNHKSFIIKMFEFAEKSTFAQKLIIVMVIVTISALLGFSIDDLMKVVKG